MLVLFLVEKIKFKTCYFVIAFLSSRFIHQGISLEDYEKQLNMILTHCISIQLHLDFNYI